MLQIVALGVAGVLAVLSTLPLFIVGSGQATGALRGFGWAVVIAGLGLSALLFYAVADQAGAFEPAPKYEAPTPGALRNPFLSP